MDPDPVQSPPSSPPHIKQNKLSPLYQMVLPKKVKNQLNLTPQSLLYSTKLRSREQPILGHPRKTKPIIWFGAILCMIFIILLICLAISTIIIFVALQPRTPVFDIPAATLGAISFNNFPEFLNGDITFLANFSNPNRKLSVGFEYLYFELYFGESVIATQFVQPFSQRPGNTRVISINLLSHLIYPPRNLAVELQKQVVMNRVAYNIKGKFRVKVEMGLVHYSYWLNGNCELEMTSPPNSAIVTHSCKTKR